MPIDPQIQRRVMGRFATGVTVVLSRHGEEFAGMTANAVASLSLSPPLVLVAVDKRAQMHAALQASRAFSINILTEAQEEISRRFAMSGPKSFHDLDLKTGESGAPLLPGSLGVVDCRLKELLPGGDHDIFVGEILSAEEGDGKPLLYYRGKYGRVAEPD